MNRGFKEMLQCVHTPENIAGKDSGTSTVPDIQRARLKWKQLQSEQSQRSYLNETQFNDLSIPDLMAEIQQFQALMNNDLALRELANQSMKVDPSLVNPWPDLGTGLDEEKTEFVSAGSCPPAVELTVTVTESALTENMNSTDGRESFKKRKSTKAQKTKDFAEEESREKKVKSNSKFTEEKNNNRETSGDNLKENSKISEVQKLDYIHVRARRGQATDSHSLAERVRREKISERMKYLQDLVPGCNKITGKAGMLDEIINYVQSLQRQVEFLSMKLAAVNARVDFNVDNFIAKEVFPSCTGGFPITGMLPEMVNPVYLRYNPVQQVVSCSGLDMTINPSDDSSFFTQNSQPSSSNWETDLQSLYNVEFHQGRTNFFPFQLFTGTMEDNNLKMEI